MAKHAMGNKAQDAGKDTSGRIARAYSRSAREQGVDDGGMTARPGEGPALEVRDLVKVYGAKGNATRALDGVTLSVAQGELTAVMGPSGSGKSTLLNCVATIDTPTSGTITVGGVDLTGLSAKRTADFRRERLGFVFQDANLLDTLTARENIALPLSIGRVPASKIAPRVGDVADLLGIGQVLDKYPYQMSGGQRQRVAIARAIVTHPALVLADEPTGALDSKNARVVLECFERLNRELGTTVLMVTHDALAASYCRRALFIRDGKLFTEVVRGDDARQQFFDRIVEVVAMVGGDQDAR